MIGYHKTRQNWVISRRERSNCCFNSLLGVPHKVQLDSSKRFNRRQWIGGNGQGLQPGKFQIVQKFVSVVVGKKHMLSKEAVESQFFKIFKPWLHDPEQPDLTQSSL